MVQQLATISRRRLSSNTLISSMIVDSPGVTAEKGAGLKRRKMEGGMDSHAPVQQNGIIHKQVSRDGFAFCIFFLEQFLFFKNNCMGIMQSGSPERLVLFTIVRTQ